MVFIDGTAVNVALPAIQSDLHATIRDVQWVVEAYALSLASMLLTGGSLGDLVGRRKVFAIGVALFGAASAWCGLAPSVAHLIAARAVQGIGGALLVPGSLALISVSFAGEARGRAIGTWSAFTSITAAIGPVLGGWLVQHGSWRAVFFINLPLAAAVLGLTLWHVPESRSNDATQRLDWSGMTLTTLGLGGVVYGLVETVPVAGLIGVVALAAFLVVEARAPAPMLPLGLFRSPSFSGANLLTFLLYAGLTGVLFFFPLDLIQVQGYSPTAAGAALMPFVLLMFLLSRWSGALVGRYGPKRPLVVGPLIAAVGFALFARPGLGGSYWSAYFPAVATLGLGMAITVAPLTATVMGSVSQNHAGLASAINNAVARIAAVVAVAAFGLAVVKVFDTTLDRRLRDAHLAPSARQVIEAQRSRLAAIETTDPHVRRAIAESFISGYRVAVRIAAALALGASVSAAVLIDDKPLA